MVPGARAACGVLLVLAALTVDYSAQFDFTKTNFEAAFQGRCGRESPCEQLCFELHDGMFECECREGYVLHLNGYGCLDSEQQKIWHRFPATPPTPHGESDDDEDAEDAGVEDVTRPWAGAGDRPEDHPSHNEIPDAEVDILYQQGAVMSAGLQDNATVARPASVTVDAVGRRADATSYVVLHASPPTPTPSPQRPTPAVTPTTVAPPKVQFVPVSAQLEFGAGAGGAATPEDACPLDCGPGGVCVLDELVGDGPRRRRQRCQCPLGRGGSQCQEDVSLRHPHFSGRGWLAFPALRAAYKKVSMHVEFRPEASDGVLLLAGERDDLTGDYLAVVLSEGFVEFRFDCGSGQGVVRSDETVVLNEWNRVSVHRQRWDASVRLNAGKWVTGRSKGLFSRITFREPLFLGGPGNTTGLRGKLPVDLGLRGCVRHVEVNGQVYDLSEDAMQGLDVEECGGGAASARCSALPCRHGGTCVAEGAGVGRAVCLCPLGWAGELCDARVDLLVPSFNGSSYLRYPGLGDAALSWLDLQLSLKPAAPAGLVLFSGAHAAGGGDFVALALVDGHLEFSFDLGSGPATVRSARPLSLGEWHEVRVSRTGRLAVLQVDEEAGAEVVAPGAFLQLSLPLSLYLGGLPLALPPAVPPSVRADTSFVGCIQKVLVNEQPLHLLEHALAGVNVDNCPHPCGARPCAPRGRCVPRGDRFTCLCPGADMTPAGQPVTECGAGEAAGEAASEHDPRVLEHRLSAGFSGNGHIHFTDMETVRRSLSDHLRVNMRLRSTSSSGLVLWLGRRPEEDDEEVQAVHQRHGVHPSFGNDFLAVAVHDGLVHLRLDLGSGELFLGYNLTRVDDGQWHRININRRGQEATISVDNGPAFGRTAPGRLRQLNANTGLYVGGVSDPARLTRGRYSSGMVGCVADLVLGEDLDFHVRLDAPSGESVNVAACG